MMFLPKTIFFHSLRSYPRTYLLAVCHRLLARRPHACRRLLSSRLPHYRLLALDCRPLHPRLPLLPVRPLRWPPHQGPPRAEPPARRQAIATAAAIAFDAATKLPAPILPRSTSPLCTTAHPRCSPAWRPKPLALPHCWCLLCSI
jgi:hypothetical protein